MWVWVIKTDKANMCNTLLAIDWNNGTDYSVTQIAIILSNLERFQYKNGFVYEMLYEAKKRFVCSKDVNTIFRYRLAKFHLLNSTTVA